MDTYDHNVFSSSSGCCVTLTGIRYTFKGLPTNYKGADRLYINLSAGNKLYKNNYDDVTSKSISISRYIKIF